MTTFAVLKSCGF